jgi:hypothetical protein
MSMAPFVAVVTLGTVSVVDFAELLLATDTDVSIGRAGSTPW